MQLSSATVVLWADVKLQFLSGVIGSVEVIVVSLSIAVLEGDPLHDMLQEFQRGGNHFKSILLADINSFPQITLSSFSPFQLLANIRDFCLKSL